MGIPLATVLMGPRSACTCALHGAENLRMCGGGNVSNMLLVTSSGHGSASDERKHVSQDHMSVNECPASVI